MLKGQLWATSDINMVNQAIMQGFRIIYLGDPISIDPNYRNTFAAVASSFVPDYNALEMQINGDESGFLNMYMAQLASPPATEMLSAVFACLYRGINVMFYLPKEASGLNFIQYFLQFIDMNYGVTTQTATTQYSFNMAFKGKVAELLYLGCLITPQEFLTNSDKLDDFTLRKLVADLHPMVEDPTDINMIIKWFSNYKDALLQSNKPLINGIQYAGNQTDYACCK